MAIDSVAAPAATPDAERRAAEVAARLFGSFGDRSRVMIVRHLARGEHRVVELTEHLGLAQSTVSKHPACLLECGIVTVRPQGRSSVYALAHSDQTMALFAAAEGLPEVTGEQVDLCSVLGA